MTYVITAACAGTKDTACVQVCPVDCIHPRPDEDAFDAQSQLYIDPAECIDCGACVPVCPVSAISATCAASRHASVTVWPWSTSSRENAVPHDPPPTTTASIRPTLRVRLGGRRGSARGYSER